MGALMHTAGAEGLGQQGLLAFDKEAAEQPPHWGCAVSLVSRDSTKETTRSASMPLLAPRFKAVACNDFNCTCMHEPYAACLHASVSLHACMHVCIS